MPKAPRSLDKAAVLKELRKLPNVGPSIALDLYDLGIRELADLKGRDPQTMYEEISRLRSPDASAYGQSGMMDRCMLYVLRAAVYYAETPEPDPKKVAWWKWSDAALSL